jgi:hypothetical protein
MWSLLRGVQGAARKPRLFVNAQTPSRAGFNTKSPAKLSLMLSVLGKVAARRVHFFTHRFNRLGLLTGESHPLGNKANLPDPANRLFGLKSGDWR